ncbi:GerAB/ArcD/ProY family transporter [Clostridiaceae bacterium UIB06]|nr:GerAB/ArcD/ProY family transporter [Clostridiaceae bacterium UIB06]
MNDTKNDITSFQLMAFTIAGSVGIGILSLPSILAKEIGHDGWIATLATGLVCLIVIVIIMLLLRKYANKSILQINFLVYGKIIGFILNIFFIVYLLFITGITVRFFVEVTQIIILKFTPVLVTTVFILGPIVYSVSKGLKVTAKLNVLIAGAYFLLLLTFLLVIHRLKFTYIMPIGKAGFLPIIKCMKTAVYSYLGFELAPLIYPNVKDKDKAFKYMILSTAITTMLFVITVLISTMLFGEVKLSIIVFPIYSIEQSITVPVIERLDTIFILFWYPTMAGTILSYFFSSYYSIYTLFNIKRKKMLLLVITIIEILISRIPKNFEALNKYSTYSGNLGAIVIGTIIITFFISLFKKEGVSSK